MIRVIENDDQTIRVHVAIEGRRFSVIVSAIEPGSTLEDVEFDDHPHYSRVISGKLKSAKK